MVLGLKGFGTGLDNLGDISDLVITPLNQGKRYSQCQI